MIISNPLVVNVTLPLLDLVEGSLLVSSNRGMSLFDAPSLSTVQSSLQFTTNDALTYISLPRLVHVGMSISISFNAALRWASIDILPFCNGSLSITHNVNLTTLSLPMVTAVHSDLTIYFNTLLSTLNLTDLAIVGADVLIEYYGNGIVDVDALISIMMLTPVMFESRTLIANVRVYNGNFSITSPSAMAAELLAFTIVEGYIIVESQGMQLPALVLPLLEYVGWLFQIYSCNMMTLIHLPALTRIEGKIFFSRNPVLSAIVFPALTYIGTCDAMSCVSLVIVNHPMLTLLSLPVLGTVVGSIDICANKPTLTVPANIRMASMFYCAIQSSSTCPAYTLCN